MSDLNGYFGFNNNNDNFKFLVVDVIQVNGARRSCRGRCRTGQCADWCRRTNRRRTSPERRLCRRPEVPVRHHSAGRTCTAPDICVNHSNDYWITRWNGAYYFILLKNNN